jgi:hypothetical protein
MKKPQAESTLELAALLDGVGAPQSEVVITSLGKLRDTLSASRDDCNPGAFA